MTTTPEAAVSDHEELWRGLPRSSVYRQRQLAGLDEAEGADELHGPIERRPGRLDEAACEMLRALSAGQSEGLHPALLTAHHLLLQWALEELESLVGCVLVSADEPASTVVRPSYVYAEDDEPIGAVVQQVARQLQTAHAVEIAAGGPAPWSSRLAPVFFYLGDGRTSRREGHLGSVLGSDPSGIVLLAAGLRDGGLELCWSASEEVGRAVGLDQLEKSFQAIVTSMSGGEGGLVGEIKNRLGETFRLPRRQQREMEAQVARIWAAVLAVSVEDLGPDSSYFELGGTSLNAFKLINLVRRDLHRDVSIRDVIERPTIRGLSRLLLNS